VQIEWFKKRRLGDVIEVASAQWGDRTAVIAGSHSWTYRELNTEVDRVAKALMAAGVKPGDHVAVWMVNRPEWVFLQFAIPRVGAVLVGLNTRYRSDDFTYVVDQADCSLLIAVDRSGPVDYAQMVAGALPGLTKLKTTVILGDPLPTGSMGWDEFVRGGDNVSCAELAARAAAVDPDAPTLIGFTSGTTSKPKGAVHTHIGMRQFHERARFLGYSKTDVHMSYLPLFHLYGMIEVSLMACLTGATQVLMEVFDADEALDLAEQHGANILHGFDFHWLAFLKAQKERPRNITMKLGTLLAGPESVTAIAYEAQDVFGPTVSGFGMSELLPLIAVSHPADSREQRCEASGHPMIDMEFRIVDPDTGEDAPINVPGVLHVRGYTTMLEYYKKPEATAEVLSPDGWFNTGDRASMRPDGHIVYLGRHKDMLKIGGENVSPAEIEARIRQIDGVFDVAVVGVRDDDLGEVGFAFVIKHDPSSQLTAEAIQTALKGRIASFKIPHYVQFVDQFPSTASGKVRKVELREEAARLVEVSV
jgi:fatty-acyl-CoA synthase